MEKIKGFAKEVFLFLSSGIFLKNFGLMIVVVVGFALFSNWFLGCYTRHGESIHVDDYIGQNLRDAERQGRDKDFEFVVLDSVFKIGKPSGIIIAQNPLPGAKVKEGRKIYVTITGNAEPVRLPPFDQFSYEYARYEQWLRNKDVEAKIVEEVFEKREANGSIKYFMHDGKKVTEQMVKAGYRVMPGDVLGFVVTKQLDNELGVPDLVCMTFSEAEFLVSTSNLIIGTVNDEGGISNQSAAYVTRQDPPAGQPIQMGSQLTIWISQDKPDGCGSDTDGPPTDDAPTGDDSENW